VGPAREGRALNLKVIAEIRCLEGNGQGGFDMARHGDARLNLGTARGLRDPRRSAAQDSSDHGLENP